MITPAQQEAQKAARKILDEAFDHYALIVHVESPDQKREAVAVGWTGGAIMAKALCAEGIEYIENHRTQNDDEAPT